MLLWQGFGQLMKTLNFYIEPENGNYMHEMPVVCIRTLWISSLPHNNFRLVQIESICRRQNRCDSKIEISFGKGRKHCGKRRKCWLPAFSQNIVGKGENAGYQHFLLFPQGFSKGFCFIPSLKVVIVW